MPVRRLTCAIDIRDLCCENARTTASPRASDVMKFGSPASAWICSASDGVASASLGRRGAVPRRVASLVAGMFDGNGGEFLVARAIIAQYVDNRL
jgi:hypothetical protein